MIATRKTNNHNLPPEIIWLMLPHLTRTGLSRLSQTCKLYRIIFLKPLFTNIQLTKDSSLAAFAQTFEIDVNLDWPDQISVIVSATKSAYKEISILGFPSYINTKLGSILNSYFPLIKPPEPLLILPKQVFLKTLLIPYDRTINHRVKGGVYGIITPKSNLKYKNMNLNGILRPCLQFPSQPRRDGIQDFIKIFSLERLQVSDKVLTKILGNLPLLHTLKIKECHLISDTTCKVISTLKYLTVLSLIGLPRVSNSGLIWISKCLNLESLSLKNTLEISEVGLKHVFYSCPFLRFVDLERVGIGNGFGIGKEIVAYLLAYAQSLIEIVLVGCLLTSEEMKILVKKSKIQKFSVGYSITRTKDLQKIKEMVGDWSGVDIERVNLENSGRGKIVGILLKDSRQIVIRG